MARIDRVRTGMGDSGKTALGDGSLVNKTHPLVEACGEVDELNCALGALGTRFKGRRRALVRSIQNDLFDLGADLSVPYGTRGKAGRARRLNRLYENFVLPGETENEARCHLARAVCRRAERRVWAFAKARGVNPEVPRYLNCLSDLLFALGRAMCGSRRKTTLWRPGASLRKK
jgi:cob(I)alamin adenosyltransferase